MTSPDPRAVALEEARAAMLDWLEASRTAARRRAELEARLAALEELDPAAADALERDLARRLATRDLFPAVTAPRNPLHPLTAAVGRVVP